MFEIVILILSWHPSRNHIGSSLVLKRCAVLMNGDSGILIYCISVEILQQRLKIESRIVMPNLTLLLCTWDVSPQAFDSGDCLKLCFGIHIFALRVRIVLHKVKALFLY